MTSHGDGETGPAGESATLGVSNEFAEVVVRRIRTGKGEKLLIEAPRRGTAIELDAVALESLTWQDPSMFSALLETPLGPEDRDSDDR